MANRHAPYHPIIYVRGFAGTQGEIDETVADPYMGFNIGRYQIPSSMGRQNATLLFRITAGSS